MRHHLPLLAAGAALFSGLAEAGVMLHYVRHAQGGHNVAYEYDQLGIPPARRPAWVGDQGRFTPLGEFQRQALATNLLAFHFDFIACSPVWRTRQTILPYLKATGRSAELWPELAETAFVGDSAAARAGQFDPAVFAGVSEIQLPVNEQAYFHFRAEPPGRRWMPATNAAQAAALALKVEDLLRARFGTNDASVLLVGHGTAGLTLVRILANDKTIGPGHMDNTRLWRLDAQADGTFKLRYHNQRAEKVGGQRTDDS
jgi:broad specificity phosphatase PhoE